MSRLVFIVRLIVRRHMSLVVMYTNVGHTDGRTEISQTMFVDTVTAFGTLHK